MRIAVYNQMFGLDGRSLLKNIIGHYYVHYQKDSGKVLSRLDLRESLNLIGKSNADIVGLCEIYEGTENEIEEGLRSLGYKYVYFGKGHKFKFSDRRVMELIASKIKCKKVEMENWPLKNTLGGGGGFVVCKFEDFTIFHVHLALPSRGFFKEQIDYLQKIIKNTEGKVILMGDFNLSYKVLRKYFLDFEIATKGLKTCSITPILKWFFWKDCDHVFVRGFKSSKADCISGRSDHKLIYVDLENGKS